MAVVKIGSNAAILGTRSALDFFVGAKIGNLLIALREAHNAKLLVDQVADADLLALGYGDGNNSTANEIGYLRSALLACEDLDKIRQGIASTKTLPYIYENDLKYACQTE